MNRWGDGLVADHQVGVDDVDDDSAHGAVERVRVLPGRKRAGGVAAVEVGGVLTGGERRVPGGPRVFREAVLEGGREERAAATGGLRHSHTFHAVAAHRVDEAVERGVVAHRELDAVHRVAGSHRELELERAHLARVIRIRETITVVVHTTVCHFRSIRVDGLVRVVTVGVVAHVASRSRAAREGARGVTEGVAVEVAVPGGFIHRGGVTVVVDAVALLDRTGVDRGAAVIAVGALQAVARVAVAGHTRIGASVAVGVGIGVPGAHGSRVHAAVHVVRELVAVLVDVLLVAHFRGAGVHVGARVVAVGTVADVARRGFAGLLPHAGVAVHVAIGVGVEHGKHTHVGLGAFGGVAVVDFTVAHLGSPVVDGGVVIVAVRVGELVLHPADFHILERGERIFDRRGIAAGPVDEVADVRDFT